MFKQFNLTNSKDSNCQKQFESAGSSGNKRISQHISQLKNCSLTTGSCLVSHPEDAFRIFKAPHTSLSNTTNTNDPSSNTMTIDEKERNWFSPNNSTK